MKTLSNLENKENYFAFSTCSKGDPPILSNALFCRIPIRLVTHIEQLLSTVSSRIVIPYIDFRESMTFGHTVWVPGAWA